MAKDDSLRQSPLWVDFCACALIVASSMLTTYAPTNPTRYIIYFAPLLYFWGWFARGFDRSYLKIRSARVYLVLLASLVFPALYSPMGAYQYFIFMSAGYSILIFNITIRFGIILFLFAMLICAQILLSLQSGMSLDSLAHFSLSTHEFVETTHSLPFLLGAFIGLFIFRKKYILAGLAVLGVLLGGKRIVILAALGAVAVQFCYSLIARMFPRYFGGTGFRILCVGSVLLFVVTVGLEMPLIAEFLARHFGFNINVFTQGRYNAQMSSYAYLSHAGIGKNLTGSGLGFVDALATKSWGWVNLIHNDVLRIFIDLGFFFGIIFLGSLIALIGMEEMGIYALSYAALIWCTDNTLIYVFFELTLSMIILSQRTPGTVAAKKELVTRQKPVPRFACMQHSRAPEL